MKNTKLMIKTTFQLRLILVLSGTGTDSTVIEIIDDHRGVQLFIAFDEDGSVMLNAWKNNTCQGDYYESGCDIDPTFSQIEKLLDIIKPKKILNELLEV